VGILPKLLRIGLKAIALYFPILFQHHHKPVVSAGPQGACYIVFHSLSLDQKSSPITEIKVPAGKVGREERKGASQEKKQLGARDKEDKKGAKMPGKEACWDMGCALGGAGEGSGRAVQGGRLL
jgi:hypothetical protein